MTKMTLTRLCIVLVVVWAALSAFAYCQGAVPSIATCVMQVGLTTGEAAAHRANDANSLPARLLVDVIAKRENRAWDVNAVSADGAVGLAQVKPIAVCSRIKGCNAEDKTRLGVIEQKLKGVAYNLCWGARILADNMAICSRDVGCALAGYRKGERVSRYIAEILK